MWTPCPRVQPINSDGLKGFCIYAWILTPYHCFNLWSGRSSSNDVGDVQGINILKAHGKSARDSYLMKGYALNTGRAAQGMPLRVAPARIACLDFNLQKAKMQMGVQVLVTDPRELEKIRQRWLVVFILVRYCVLNKTAEFNGFYVAYFHFFTGHVSWSCTWILLVHIFICIRQV